MKAIKAKLLWLCICMVILVILSFPKASVGDDNTSVLSLEGITLGEVKLYIISGY